jgi:hypothetical protein
MKVRIVFRNSWWRAQLIGAGGGGWLGLDWHGRQANVRFGHDYTSPTAGGLVRYCREHGHEVENAGAATRQEIEEWTRFNERAKADAEKAKERIARRHSQVPCPTDGNGRPA